MRTRWTAAAVAIGAASAFALTGWVPATAQQDQKSVVSAKPSSWTPWVKDGTVKAVAAVGNKIVVGGTFTTVQPAGTSKTKAVKRDGLFAFDRGTGKIDSSFHPTLDGSVNALASGAAGTVYVGGTFKNVNGSAQRGLAQLSVSTGHRVATFTSGTITSGQVNTLARNGGSLYAGGAFSKIGGAARSGLARLSATTGKAESNFDMPIAKSRLGTLRVQRLAVDPSNEHLVVTGTFTEVAGKARNSIAMIDNPASKPSVSSWSTDGYAHCRPDLEITADGVDFSPNGDYFVVAATGAYIDGHSMTSTLCDAVSRFDTNKATANVKPAWTDWTGGDSLYSVAATGSAVYVGGHQRWLDNPHGNGNNAGPGAVSRPGIGAVSSTTGKALSWDPTKTRGHGVEALVADSHGLWVGSDTDELAKQYHPRLGYFPMSGKSSGGGTSSGGSGHSGGTGSGTGSSSGQHGTGAHHATHHHHAPHATGSSGSTAQHASDKKLTSAAHSAKNVNPSVRHLKSASDKGGLPFTGMPAGLLGGIAAVLVLAGGGGILLAKKLRSQH